MTTGSISYSPDYKSIDDRPPLNVVFEQGMERQRLNAERARLEREVIEAVKAEHEAFEKYNGNSTMENWHAIFPLQVKRKAAVQVLIDFEAQIKK